MRPIRSCDERNDFDKLVAKETGHGGLVSEEVGREELSKLHPLGGVNR